VYDSHPQHRRIRRPRDHEDHPVVQNIWHWVLCGKWEMRRTSSLLAFMSASNANSSFFFLSFFFEDLLSMFAIAQSSSSIFAFSICVVEVQQHFKQSYQASLPPLSLPRYPHEAWKYSVEENVLNNASRSEYWKSNFDTKKLALSTLVVLYTFEISIGNETWDSI